MEQINKYCLGTAQLGIDEYGINNSHRKPREEDSHKILDYLLTNGVSTLDTSSLYGEAESIIGKYRNRHKFNIYTKINKDDSLDASLNRLRLNKVEGCFIHHFEDYDKIYEDLVINKKDGIVNKIGFSLYHPKELDYILNNEILCDMIQIPYNLFDRRFNSKLKVAKSFGIEVFARSCFLQGLFFMKDTDNNKIRIINNFAKSNNVDISKVAIDFCLMNEYIDYIVIGSETIDQIKDNVKIFNSNNILDFDSDFLDSVKENDENIILPYNWVKNV